MIKLKLYDTSTHWIWLIHGFHFYKENFVSYHYCRWEMAIHKTKFCSCAFIDWINKLQISRKFHIHFYYNCTVHVKISEPISKAQIHTILKWDPMHLWNHVGGHYTQQTSLSFDNGLHMAVQSTRSLVSFHW